MISLRALPARNFGSFDAGILIFSPVRGLRPSPASRCATVNVPKPTKRTSVPCFKEAAIESKTPSTALAASTLVRPAIAATDVTRSFLFTDCFLLFVQDLDRLPEADNTFLSYTKRADRQSLSATTLKEFRHNIRHDVSWSQICAAPCLLTFQVLPSISALRPQPKTPANWFLSPVAPKDAPTPRAAQPLSIRS